MLATLPALEYPTAPDTTVAVGDFVRSYDFPGRTDCFILGSVTAIRGEMYIIAVAARVWQGEVDRVQHTEHVGVQVNGTGHGWYGVLRGVVKGTEEDWSEVWG